MKPIILVVTLIAASPALAADKSSERPYSCRLLEDEQRKCAFGGCDHRVVERLTLECLRDALKGADQGKRVPVAAEQQALADMARMRAEGRSLRDIAEAIKARGLSISHQSVKRALHRAAAVTAGGAA